MAKSPAELGQEMMLLGTYEDYDAATIITVLKTADDLYHSDAESFLEDSEYDALRKYAEGLEPHNSYFTGVGAEVRGGKVKLPYQMGSLDQVQIGDIEQWVIDNDLTNEETLITDKLDGTSAMVLYDDLGNLQIAFSRGDGIQGADITRHIKHFVPQTALKKMVVRGEVILTKTDFPILRGKVKSRSGKPYKNARNMVSGLMNASTNDPLVYQYLHFVAYEIVGVHGLGKAEMLDTLDDLRFRTPERALVEGAWLTDDGLAAYLTERRRHTEYEIDGIVIDADHPTTRNRMNPTRDTLNPAYSIKYKVADASNMAIATVKKVEWRPSKHSYLNPRVHLEPVELVGVTVKHATGFNAKFIHDNRIGPGATVRITRSGDVIPLILGVVTPAATPQMPDQRWAWNDTGVDAVLLEQDERVEIERITYFFSAIDAPYLKKGNVQKLYDLGYDSIVSIILMSRRQMVTALGENGGKIYDGLALKLTDIPLYMILGAHATARGIGQRKIKKLQKALGGQNLLICTNAGLIARQDGFDDTSALKVVRCLEEFRTFLKDVANSDLTVDYNLATGGSMTGQNVVFTGFRDKGLAKLVEDEGGNIQSAVSGKTNILVAANPNSNSGKMKKARDKGVLVVGIDEFKDML